MKKSQLRDNKEMEMYDLEAGIGERNIAANQFPDVIIHLQELAEKARQDMGDALTQRQGIGQRGPGQID